ncbi:hypothetical protein CHS0354_029256 [Potamilus streckersoni]|uniref:Uncharacterized protein n=1 Tax=Potamilus streckersoni TaxID=2493646 RepID=A0AAE0W5J1_9BIVA|nr:hypothetical protein CHS0354_029256 [Potamilus streckersoni]
MSKSIIISPDDDKTVKKTLTPRISQEDIGFGERKVSFPEKTRSKTTNILNGYMNTEADYIQVIYSLFL